MRRILILALILTASFAFACKGETSKKNESEQSGESGVTETDLKSINEKNAESEADKLLKELDDI